MAHIQADRVRDTTTTTGTGAITVSGTAPTTYRTFSSVCSSSDTFYYVIQHQTANEWEVGLGTYSGTNQITRTTVYSSSNANAAVSFSAGTKDVVITLAADRTVSIDNAGKIPAYDGSNLTNINAGNISSGTLAVARGGTGITSLGTGVATALGNASNAASGLVTLDANNTIGVGTVAASGYGITSQLPITVNYQGINITPNASSWAGQLTMKGSGYSGGLAMDASGLWLGHNSSARSIIFATNATERMRLDASGNLGIGKTPSGFALDVAGGAQFAANCYMTAGYFRNSDGGSAASPSIQPGPDADTGMYWISSNVLGFTTGGTRRLQITSTGQLISEADETSYCVYAYNANAAPLGYRIHYSSAAPNGTGNVFIAATDTAGTKFALRSNGGIANYSANNVNLSDRREKTDFQPSGDYLDKICQIPVQKFRYINQAADDDGLTLGAVAQDVQAVCPELVMESDWSNGEAGQEPKMRLSIYQTDLQYALMRAIQELKAELDAVKAQLPTQ